MNAAAPDRGREEAPAVLVAEDDDRLRPRLARAFRDRGWRAFEAASCEAVAEVVADQMLDLAVVDLRLGADHGLDAVRVIHDADDETVTLVLTGYGSVATAVAALRAGASDYLAKPADADQLLDAYERARRGVGQEVPPVAVPSLSRVEWEHIQRVLSDCDGNVTRAAALLGLHRRTLQRKLAKRPSPGP